MNYRGGRPPPQCTNLCRWQCTDSNVTFVSLPSGQNDEELSCNQNDVVSVLEDLGDGWLRVRKGQDEGYVPESYVQIK